MSNFSGSLVQEVALRYICSSYLLDVKIYLIFVQPRQGGAANAWRAHLPQHSLPPAGCGSIKETRLHQMNYSVIQSLQSLLFFRVIFLRRLFLKLRHFSKWRQRSWKATASVVDVHGAQ